MNGDGPDSTPSTEETVTERPAIPEPPRSEALEFALQLHRQKMAAEATGENAAHG